MDHIAFDRRGFLKSAALGTAGLVAAGVAAPAFADAPTGDERDVPEGEGEDDAQPDAPADEPEQPEAAPQDEPAAEEAPADEPQIVQADEQPADADEGENGEDNEPVCDGHCDTCTLECDAAERGETAAEQADERPKGEDSAE